MGAALILTAMTLARGEATLQSGPERVTLVELYTSEGCSSCPPAEKWLGNLKSDPALWKAYVPVAFHVNYWDRLGWRDRLATAKFTAREHAYAKAWRSASVYTPCFVRNGEEWRARNATAADLRSHSPDANAGLLTVTWQANQSCRIEYTPASDPPMGRFEVNVALLGSGIVTKVRAGENSGRELRHDFVALGLETTELKREESGRLSATVVLPARTDITADRQALAAWITKRGDLTPLQAVGGWIK